MKIIQIIAIGISIFMVYLTVGVLLNSGLDSKYSASQEDIDYVFTFSKILLGYLILIIAVITATLIRGQKKRT